jgi:putative cardiolipin synthase
MAASKNGTSAFHIVPMGADGFLVRMQMINAAERTLDLQYFIFRGDETGRLLTDAVLRAADRGVRVRLLIDDGDTLPGDEQIAILGAHRSIELRIFNPFAYRGHLLLFRSIEFIFNAARLDYRMHNKLMIVDNAAALIGGRNIGDAYFQIATTSQYADDDVFAAGPVTSRLSTTFDEYWNSQEAIPSTALGSVEPSAAILRGHRQTLRDERLELQKQHIDYVARIATGEPLAGILSGRTPLIWANVQVICDTPNKREVEAGDKAGRMMREVIAENIAAVQSELLIVTPYLVPGKQGLNQLALLTKRSVRVTILTSSLESSNSSAPQAGYRHYRRPLLNNGIQLYEIRSLLGNTHGSGETATISMYGTYSLHAKFFVFDRQRLFIGSMNFDQRSMHLNTEIGLLIDSPELADQVAARFQRMIEPENSYKLGIRPDNTNGAGRLVWRTRENGNDVELEREPARSNWQRFKVGLLSLAPFLEDEL